MKKEDRDMALTPTQYRVPGSNRMINLRTLNETDEKVFNTIYYKEIPIVTGSMDKTVIVTYSPKYKAYQQKIRNRQIERAVKIIVCPEKRERGKIRMTLHVLSKKHPLRKMAKLPQKTFTV